MCKISSCPLSGASISQYWNQRRNHPYCIVLVPSRGHLYLNSNSEHMREIFGNSRPLSGPSISQYIFNGSRVYIYKFSSPLGAIYISILSPASPVNVGLKLRFAAQTEMGCPVPPFCSPQPSFSRYLQGAAENQVLRSFIP